MSVLSIFDLQEKVISKKGADAACPYCGGPVLAIDFDAHLLFCFLPISHKVKQKFYCTICSRRLIPAHS
ncbi:Methionyl-tRNA synthetase [Melia azedarach]|uniref:Methionyl-tRNA synthetase n=2 Tax=Melia azedarach TaxID=155640 RepID=A0ACC1Y575_MELAZ|nr:Methionyl-tRNA synthetase [Melia azedarach]KAJ4718758.1 Methionyl-tRNA synthetase [Melia azedarach]